MTDMGGQKGFTLVEVVVASLLLTFIVAVLLHYHGSSGVSKNQEYYLKAVQVARAELEKLRSLYEMVPEAAEFTHTGPPPGHGLHHASGIGEGIVFEGSSGPTYHVYYTDHGAGDTFLRGLGDSPPYGPLIKSGISMYQEYYCEAYNKSLFEDTDGRDRRTFTYFTSDTEPGYPPHSDAATGRVDASLVVIDDMGSPYECKDDLLGGIGWWVEDVAISGVTYCKKVAFFLVFRYPGQSQSIPPEIICLRTTMVKP